MFYFFIIFTIIKTHNKKRNPSLYSLINCIHDRSQLKQLSLKDEYLKRFLNFLIVSSYNYLGNCWFGIIAFLIANLFYVPKISDRACVTALPISIHILFAWRLALSNIFWKAKKSNVFFIFWRKNPCIFTLNISNTKKKQEILYKIYLWIAYLADQHILSPKTPNIVIKRWVYFYVFQIFLKMTYIILW